MIEVLTVNEERYEAYSSYVTCHPQARFGHDLEWAFVLRQTYGVAIEHLIAFENKHVVGVCPLFFCNPILGGAHYTTSLFPSYFGPLYDSVQVLDAILQVVRKKTGYLQYTEILSTQILPATNIEYLPFIQKPDYSYKLSLRNESNEIFSQFSENYRRILRKAKTGEEMEVIIDLDGTFVDEFYKIYADVYAQKHGFIPHVKRLFQNIFSYYERGIPRIYLSKINNRYIGGIFTFWTHGEIYYAWSATNSNHTYHPTHLLIWKMIQDGIEERYNWFNMGESPKSFEGLNRFKKGWHTEIDEPCRYFVPGQLTEPKPRLFDRVSWSKKIISHLPVEVTTMFLSPAIRYFL